MISQKDTVADKNSPVRLIQTRKVLTRRYTSDDYVLFGIVDEDTPGRYINVLYLDLLDWQDMSYPETITITVVPGDDLNED